MWTLRNNLNYLLNTSANVTVCLLILYSSTVYPFSAQFNNRTIIYSRIPYPLSPFPYL